MKMKSDIGWTFPPTGGGAADGFNDASIAHFKGSPISSLARETIQNSLDARSNSNEPVHVSFELKDLDQGKEFGKEQLAAAIEASLQSPHSTSASEVELQDAKLILEAKTVRCLLVSDRNTTGLTENHWRALVKTRGLSIKSGEGAGGSHGIGKAAPFAVTPLRTVFYWTHYKSGGRSVEKFQGKAVLMSHISNKAETQGTGFFGIRDGCREVVGDAVPEAFRLRRSLDGPPVQGTALYVLGFRADADWRRRIAESVISNYFYAIAEGLLDVTVEPDDTLEQLGLDQIDAKSLAQWFEYLEEEPGGDDVAEEGWSALAGAKAFWKLSRSGLTPVEKQDQDLGHCQLWIKVADGLPGRVGFVRNTGMLITTQQRNLVRFPRFRDFAALCVFEDPHGNELLRMMENPQHDQFEPDRLPENQRTRGRRALKRITDWIRAEVRKCAGPPEAGGNTMLTELATYVPDLHPDDSFDDADAGGGREPGFGERVTVTLKPIRRSVPPSLPEDDSGEEAEGDAGLDIGNDGGGGIRGSPEGGGGNGGEGEGEGGTGGRGGVAPHKAIPVSGVRLLPLTDRPNCYRLSFRAAGTGVARLELHEAGDSTTIFRRDIRTVPSEGDAGESLEAVTLAQDGRTELTITADEPIGGRAWRLSAVSTRQA